MCSTSIVAIGAPAHCGIAATNSLRSRPRPVCLPASATSSSTRCALQCSRIRHSTAGAATARTRLQTDANQRVPDGQGKLGLSEYSSLAPFTFPFTFSQFAGTATEKEAKAQALFEPLFGSVIIGTSNTQYNNIRYVLSKLDVDNRIAPAHENHFHVTMAPPPAKEITKTSNLLAESTQEDTLMFDLPYNPTDALVLAQATTPPALAAPQPNWISNDPRSLKALTDSIRNSERYTALAHTYTENGPLGIPALIWNMPIENITYGDEPSQRRPIGHALGLATNSCYILDVLAKQAGAWGPECKITKYITMPKGKLSPATWEGPREGDFTYTPRRAGSGIDTARFILENGAGKKVDVTVKIGIDKWTPEGGSIEADTKFTELEQDDAVPAWFASNAVDGYIADSSGVTYSFSSLDGSAVGQTTGNAIALDADAAGHGWFVDPTPGSNEEFLPTSNPNEWVAKAGSEAAGKMDMLSVLLHEYGHALGIEHSADSGDFMATTLTPGVRRLPSAEELALMAQLVGEIKSASDGAPDTPYSPSLPIGTTLSALLVGRLRRSAYGSWSPVFDSVQIPAPAPQFDIAANATLTDPKLQMGTGWEAEGNVSIGNGAAILSEATTSQTRLNQVFIVGEHDRYLSFNVAGIGLDGQTGGPDDAFEVGLLDANSGVSLAGTISLSHSDALLDLQADDRRESLWDGTEFTGQGVTSARNADGSRRRPRTFLPSTSP